MGLIDPRTAMLLAGVMSGLMSLVLYALKRNYPASIKGLGEWSAALLVLFVAGLLVTTRGTLPDFVSISVSAFLLWSGLYLAYVGSQRFFGVTPRVRLWMSFITGMLLIQVWFNLVEPSYHVRMILTTLVTACLSAVHAWLIVRQRSITFARALAIGVLVFLAASQIIRLASSFGSSFSVNAEFFETSTLNLIYITSFTFSILLFSISTLLMAAERLRTELEHLASHDSLTHTLTRRHMNEACDTELERCRRHGQRLALLMMDLDHFKAINDTYGHQAGDRVLVDFTAKVNALLRRTDKLGRFGGEEFMLLLPETSLEEAIMVAERIRETCAVGAHGPACTVSIGVTTNRQDIDTVDALLARADAAMYRAKAHGRNRVETS